MLPVPYFHVTVTVPEELRNVLRRHQVDGYGALMKTTAGAIIDLARNPRWIGGTVGVLAVLHTWTQRLVFHPHIHCLVTGGGLLSLSKGRRRRHLASCRQHLPVPQLGARHPGPRALLSPCRRARRLR